MKKVWERFKKDLRQIMPAFLFFFCMFQILFYTRSLMLQEYGITLQAHAVAFLGALIISKAIFIADQFPFLNFYPKRPLLWNILFKTFTFGMLTFLFLFAEELFHQVHKHGSLAAALEWLTVDVAWPVFWAGEIWVVLLLFFYCGGRELARTIGIEKIREIVWAKKGG